MQDRTKEAPMRKLIAGLFVSLDGFATDTNEEMRWMTDDFGEEPGYGGRETADVNLLYAERGRALAPLVSWAEEARALAEEPVL
jgi:hypothetical protein